MAARMDVSPASPASESLLLDSPRSTAPFVATVARGPLLEREQTTQKPLRPVKERAPVAAEIDAIHVRGMARAEAATIVAPTRLSPSGSGGGPPSTAAPLAPSAPAIFPGGSDNNTSIPPDTAGAVGPNHVFNPLNNNVWIFDRAGTQAAPTVSLDNFWSGLGVQGNTFDPRVVFDPYGGRYIFATMADAGRPSSRLLVAVSTNSDPMQWVSHAIQVDDAAQGQVWFDFPSVGFTADKITVQVNLFTRAGNQFAGSTIYAIDKQSLYNPPHQAPVQRFIIANKGATLVPAVTYDPALNDQYIVSRWGGNIQGQGFVLINVLTGNVALGQATLTQVGFLGTTLTWDPFPPGDIGPQIGISDKVAVGDDRVLGVCVRNGKLYCCHAVMLPTGAPTRSAVQWWEIDIATWSVLHVGRIDDASGGTCYAAPSIAVNNQNDLLIGHAELTTGTHPSGAYLLRAAGQSPSPQVFAPGRATYFKTFGGQVNRWGDYSHAQVDPNNDRDFWTVQEFADNPADTWATMWANVVVQSAGTV